ncbi:Ribonuclease P protein subunit P38-related [Striga hermonthica]|uniref:Ribonuclease P protein subunit P38-related n=1 Tax=Striga hermonthica TaxID=68872 RepID=A0A9N7RR81_STRHE|nr:Ribonuclease P protein subunit P38-related [Striga hermonthica]
MAAQKDEEKRSVEGQEQKLHDDNDDDHHYHKLLSSYLGISFAFFLGSLPRSSIALISNLQAKNKALASKLMRAEEQLGELLSRRKEDSKANARVVEIFASHRHSWQQEEKRLLLQIDECGEEIAYLKGKIEEFEGLEADLKARVEDLRREVGERDEMLNFMSRETHPSKLKLPSLKITNVKPMITTNNYSSLITTTFDPIKKLLTINPQTIDHTQHITKKTKADENRPSLANRILNALDDFVNSNIDIPFHPSIDPKTVLSDNFAPVDELPPTACTVVEGSLPRCLDGVG